MNKFTFVLKSVCLIFTFLISQRAFAQSPELMSYQAVVRNTNNALVANQAVGVRVTILQTTPAGTEVYKELFNPNPTTNANGLLSVNIGSGTPVTGTMAAINWGAGPYFVKTEIDPTGGTNYGLVSTSQLLSVPFAMYAKTSGGGDNLGNHTATTAIKLNNQIISNNGNNGFTLDDNGGLKLKTTFTDFTTPTPVLDDTFSIDKAGGLLLKGRFPMSASLPTTTIPMQGPGARMMWYPAKESFRMGRVSGTQWDDVNTGEFSVAFGNDNIAKGYGSFAMGDLCDATGTVSVSMGSNNKVAGTAGFSVGASNIVNGFAGVALGYTNIANGQGTVAIGYRVQALKDYTVSLGYRGIANHEGSMVLSDASNNSSFTTSTADNQLTSRYAGGYRLFTNSNMTIGVAIVPGGNSWSIISDSTRKERFLHADGDEMLKKLRTMRLGSWNYKSQAEVNFRHYGPMAQEFYAAFGQDKYGTIGNETTIGQADMEGVMMILIKALEKRTAEQDKEIAKLKAQNSELNTALFETKKINEEWLTLKTLLSENESTKNIVTKLNVLTEDEKKIVENRNNR